MSGSSPTSEKESERVPAAYSSQPSSQSSVSDSLSQSARGTNTHSSTAAGGITAGGGEGAGGERWPGVDADVTTEEGGLMEPPNGSGCEISPMSCAPLQSS